MAELYKMKLYFTNLVTTTTIIIIIIIIIITFILRCLIVYKIVKNANKNQTSNRYNYSFFAVLHTKKM